MDEQLNQEGAEARGAAAGSVIEKVVTVFILAYGMHYLGYFLRARYFSWLETLSLDEGFTHACLYLGHLVFFIVLVLYALAVKNDRKYIFAIFTGSPLRNLKYALLGAVFGFVLMGICVFAAAMNGNLEIRLSSAMAVPLFLFSMLAVLVQASVEEIESRGFVFGKMTSEGVPLIPAMVISAFFFSYLHAANPGFGLIPLTSIFVVGILYALSYHYFDTLWFVCTAHMMWNFTQDFIFGLPDSGKPAAVSLFSTTVNGSSFFYDESFGIEGSWMAIAVNSAACLFIFVIGQIMKSRAKKTEQQSETY